MKYVLIGWLVIIIAFLIALSFIPIGKEPLTELYFNNHLNLPKQGVLYKSYNASFTINNLEYKWMNYPYIITEQYGNTTRIVLNSSVELEDNSSATIPFDFSFNEHFTRARVQVTLVEKNQSIHLWVDEKV